MDGARPETTTPWRKSSYSSDTANCVEFAQLSKAGVGVRDSKDPGGPVLIYGAASWRAFVEAVSSGGFTGSADR